MPCIMTLYLLLNEIWFQSPKKKKKKKKKKEEEEEEEEEEEVVEMVLRISKH